jgi:hypothetical protein
MQRLRLDLLALEFLTDIVEVKDGRALPQFANKELGPISWYYL